MFSPFVFYSTFSLTFILPHRLHLPLVFASSLILSRLKHCPHPCSLALTVSHSRPPWQLHFISPFYFQVASGSDPYHGRELALPLHFPGWIILLPTPSATHVYTCR